MKLSTEKLEEVEYYEQKFDQGHNMRGIPYAKDILILHFGEYEKEHKLFGTFTIWTETIPDRTEKFTFERIRESEGEPDEDGNQRYSFQKSDGFRKIMKQLEAYFDDEFGEVYKALQRHEINYIVS